MEKVAIEDRSAQIPKKYSRSNSEPSLSVVNTEAATNEYTSMAQTMPRGDKDYQALDVTQINSANMYTALNH